MSVRFLFTDIYPAYTVYTEKLLIDWGCFNSFLVWSFLFVGALYFYTKYYLLVTYHVLYFVMINKGCLVAQTMPGFLGFVDLV